jgi:hypothetical protein
VAGGYTVQRSVYKLTFEDPSLEGLEVRVRAMTIREMMDVTDEFAGDLSFMGRLTPGMKDNPDKLMEWFARYLVSWNLEEEPESEEDEPTPIPATLDGVKSLELPFFLRILLAWLPATAGVQPDLKEGSASGESSLEESIPMEPLSPSQVS